MTIKTAASMVTGFVGSVVPDAPPLRTEILCRFMFIGNDLSAERSVEDDAPYTVEKITPIPWNWGYTIVIHYSLLLLHSNKLACFML